MRNGWEGSSRAEAETEWLSGHDADGSSVASDHFRCGFVLAASRHVASVTSYAWRNSVVRPYPGYCADCKCAHSIAGSCLAIRRRNEFGIC
jgi:hypothetical protein